MITIGDVKDNSLLSKEEAAAILKVSTATITRWGRKNLLSISKIGKRTFVTGISIKKVCKN